MKRSEDTVGAKLQADAFPPGEVVIGPLRKRRLSGELYERDPKVNALVAELAILPRDTLIARAEITKRSDRLVLDEQLYDGRYTDVTLAMLRQIGRAFDID